MREKRMGIYAILFHLMKSFLMLCPFFKCIFKEKKGKFLEKYFTSIFKFTGKYFFLNKQKFVRDKDKNKIH